jgi:iron complex transport system permease protein
MGLESLGWWSVSPEILSWVLGRASVAAIVGAGLGGAGAVLQRYLNNDLADPYLLGVSGASVLGAVLAGIVVPASWVFAVPPQGLLLLSLVGAALGGGLVLALLLWGRERLYRNVAGLVLLGVIINALCSSLTLLVMAWDHPLYPQVDYGLLMGRIEAYSWLETLILVVLVGLGLTLLGLVQTFVAWSPYGGAAVPVSSKSGLLSRYPEVVLLVGISVIASTSAAYVGAIGFVGLMVPHLARGLTRSFWSEFILSIILGGVVLVAADALVQRVVWPRVLPVGVATSLIGALALAWLLRRRMMMWHLN